MKLIVDIDKNDYYRFKHGFASDDDSVLIEKIFENAVPLENLTEADIQEVLNKCCMTAVANEYLIALHNKNCKPKGKWIPRLHASENDIYVCSCCAKELGYDPNFCPNCGADMRN